MQELLSLHSEGFVQLHHALKLLFQLTQLKQIAILMTQSLVVIIEFVVLRN